MFRCQIYWELEGSIVYIMICNVYSYILTHDFGKKFVGGDNRNKVF